MVGRELNRGPSRAWDHRTLCAGVVALVLWHQYVVLGFCDMLAYESRDYRGAKTTAVMNIALIGMVHVVVKVKWMALNLVQWVAGDAWLVAAMVSWAL